MRSKHWRTGNPERKSWPAIPELGFPTTFLQPNQLSSPACLTTTYSVSVMKCMSLLLCMACFGVVKRLSPMNLESWNARHRNPLAFPLMSTWTLKLPIKIGYHPIFLGSSPFLGWNFEGSVVLFVKDAQGMGRARCTNCLGLSVPCDREK